MISNIDTGALWLGLVVGLPMSALFFWGLNWGMRLALNSTHPGRLLMLSFFCRMVLLLAVALLLSRFTGSLLTLAGYMLAFLLVRVLVVIVTKQRGV